MIRAIFFDFYSVWTPDKIGYYLAYAGLMSPVIYKELCDATEKYYMGDMSINDLADTFSYKLGSTDISQDTFKITANSISPQISDFMKALHGHFVKVGVLANLGQQEYEVLKQFNQASEIIETIASPYSLSIKKPLLDQEVFNMAFEAIGETADSCLIVSGNPYYLAFAKIMGVQTLQFEGLEQLETSINQMVANDMPS